MDLIHNQTFRLLESALDGAYPAGIYRVIFDEPVQGSVVCVCQRPDTPRLALAGGRKQISHTKSPRRKSPAKLNGEMFWLNRVDLQRALAERTAITVELLYEAVYFLALESPKDQELVAADRKLTHFGAFC